MFRDRSLDDIVRHLGKLGYDRGDGVFLTHVVDLERREVDRLVKIADELHVLELGDNGVLEALLEHVVGGLLDSALTLSLLSLLLEGQKELGARLLVTLLSEPLVLLHHAHRLVDMLLFISLVSLKGLQVQLELALLVSEGYS